MTSYQYRANPVEAMYFDGSHVGARAIADWLAQLMPGLTVRQRIEYRGWEDPDGHLELEIRDHEAQCMVGDWIVIDPSDPMHQIQFLRTSEFLRRFEVDPR